MPRGADAGSTPLAESGNDGADSIGLAARVPRGRASGSPESDTDTPAAERFSLIETSANVADRG